jgi:menaquinone-dependent protoporphyrinogen oxidase
MKVLVAVASKHGATDQIAREISASLRDTLSAAAPAAAVEVRAVDQVQSVDGYDAVVLGSAVYMGHWLPVARKFADQQAAALSAVPVWLFSSGPIGDPPKPEQDAVEVAAISAALGARGHHNFTGRLDKQRLGFTERAVTRALHAAEGDFRDWPAIREWAREIGEALTARQLAPELDRVVPSIR